MPLTREELLTAVEENPEALFGLFASHTSEARFRRDETMRRMSFGVPVSFFNGVAMAHLTVDNCDKLIHESVEEMTRNGLPWSWQIGPSSTPFDLSRRLINSGMQFSHDMPIMAMNAKALKPRELPANYNTVPVNDLKSYDQFIEIAEDAFGLPPIVFHVFRRAQEQIGFAPDAPLRNFLGIVNGEPVCTGTVFYSHGVAGVFTIGTPTAHRGHGYGTAMTEACILDAQQKGFDTVFLQSSKMGYPVYSKIGFEEICQISIYVPQEP